MAPPKSVTAGRVNILLLIGEAVMVAMMGCPPERTPLNRCIANRPEYKLPETIGFEGFVGKIAVVEAGDGKHSDTIKQHAHANGRPAPTDPENPQAH